MNQYARRIRVPKHLLHDDVKKSDCSHILAYFSRRDLEVLLPLFVSEKFRFVLRGIYTECMIYDIQKDYTFSKFF